jgi:hypothetical protein
MNGDYITMNMANFVRGGPMRLSNFIAGAPNQPGITKTIRYDIRDRKQVMRVRQIAQRAYDMGLEPDFVRNPRARHEIQLTLTGPRDLVLRSLNSSHSATRKSSSGSKRKSSSASKHASTRRRQHQ